MSKTEEKTMKVWIKLIGHMPMKLKGLQVTGIPVLAHLGTKNLGGRINTVCYQFFFKKENTNSQAIKQTTSNQKKNTQRSDQILP